MLVLKPLDCSHLDVESRAHNFASSYELWHHSAHSVYPNGKPHTCEGTSFSHPANSHPLGCQKGGQSRALEEMLQSMA